VITRVHTAHGMAAYRLEMGSASFFIKAAPFARGAALYGEADGLKLLGRVQACRIPPVLYVGPSIHEAFRDAWTNVRLTPDDPMFQTLKDHVFLVLPWLEERGAIDAAALKLGRCLAMLHQAYEPQRRYGIDHSIALGAWLNAPGWGTDWVHYFGEQKMWPLIHALEQQGRLPLHRAKKLETLLERLDQWLPHHPAASLLHGDLWSGNVLVTPDHEPYVIDPASFYGDRVVDLAMMKLFGGFPEAVWQAYDERYPLDAEDMIRLPVYQVYYLLVHLYLFGESYGASIDRILKRYV